MTNLTSFALKYVFHPKHVLQAPSKCFPVWRSCCALLCFSHFLHSLPHIYLCRWLLLLFLWAFLLVRLLLPSLPLVRRLCRILAHPRASILRHVGLSRVSSGRTTSPELCRGPSLVGTRTQDSRQCPNHCPICEHSRCPPHVHLYPRGFRHHTIYRPWPRIHRKAIVFNICSFHLCIFLQSFVPTLVFTAIIPQFLEIYRRYAQRLTQWENHEHQSSFDASLTTKSFVLSSIVSYLGMALSAFIYVPFGETVMNSVQHFLSLTSSTVSSLASSGVDHATEKAGRALFVSDANTAHAKLSGSRLQKEMFAYMVTNQVSGWFMEVGLPFLTRAFASVRSRRRPSLSGASAAAPKKKRVGFDDDKSGGARDEREFLERVRREVSLPQYGLFQDYDEMVTQFGYVALWSTIWPLAPCWSFFSSFLRGQQRLILRTLLELSDGPAQQHRRVPLGRV